MSGKPVILFINHWAAHLGGAEHSLLDIMRTAAARSSSHLLTSEPGVLVERAAEMGVACHVVPCRMSTSAVRRGASPADLARAWPQLLSFARFVFSVARLVRSIRPDLVHANVPKSHMTLCLLVLLGYRGKSCFHLREIFPDRSYAAGLYRLLYPRRSASVCAISHAVKNHLPARMRRDATVIHNGVLIPPEPAGRAPDGQFRFLYLGRIVPWKGCHVLVDAFARALDLTQGSPCSLTLVGDTLYWRSAYRDELRELIRTRGLEPRCRLLPHTDDPAATMREHDAFCIASDQEPFGRVVAEAQACGLPVVGYDTGGVGEIVTQGATGLLVSFGNIDAFAHAMCHLVKNPNDARAMGKAGREKAMKLFDRAVQVPKIVEFLLKQAAGEE
jgi:glycosyltransferase involved in cell wall biosynthesis